MGPVKQIAIGGEVGRGGPDRKPSLSSYNGNSVGVTVTNNFIGVYNTRNVVKWGKELFADQQMWHPHNWRQLVNMIRDDDPTFRNALLEGDVTADFGDVGQRITQHQKLEVTAVTDTTDKDPIYEWRLYDRGPGDEGLDWDQQTIVLRYDHAEMTDFVEGVMAGDLRFTPDLDRDVSGWQAMDWRPAQDVGRTALTLVA